VPSYACPYCYTTFSTYPVYWTDINSAAACTPNTTVYNNWSGPLGYCSEPVSSTSHGVFSAPHQAINTQGLIIASCVFLAIAGVVGCFDAAREDDSAAVAKSAIGISFIAMILLICSFSLWVDFPFTALTTSYDGSYIPVWVNPYENLLSAVPVYFVLGPGWGCALFAFILNIFAVTLHCLSISSMIKPPELPPIPDISKSIPVPQAIGGNNNAAAVDSGVSVSGPVVSV
jgi:hypothetical protein